MSSPLAACATSSRSVQASVAGEVEVADVDRGGHRHERRTRLEERALAVAVDGHRRSVRIVAHASRRRTSQAHTTPGPCARASHERHVRNVVLPSARAPRSATSRWKVRTGVGTDHHVSGRSTTGASRPSSRMRASRNRNEAIPAAPWDQPVPGASSGTAARCSVNCQRDPAASRTARDRGRHPCASRPRRTRQRQTPACRLRPGQRRGARRQRPRSRSTDRRCPRSPDAGGPARPSRGPSAGTSTAAPQSRRRGPRRRPPRAGPRR